MSNFFEDVQSRDVNQTEDGGGSAFRQGVPTANNDA